MKILSDILFRAKLASIAGNPQTPVQSVQFDSRKVSTGDLFVAIKGTQADGHDYISMALDRGAAAVVCEKLPEVLPTGICFVVVEDTGEALGIIADNYFNHPSEEVRLIGVTGTNGKTTIATLLYQVFTDSGYVCGLLSTIRNIIGGKVKTATHTTPDPLQLNQLLRELADLGGSYCFMEVSSHAVAQNRIAGLKFAGGIFTNLTHDHLDYHKTFQDYLLAKKKFFDRLPATAFALTNTDDKNGRVMVQNTKARVSTYALKSAADFKCRVIENLPEGLQVQINNREILCRLTGEFNAYNLAAVFGTASLLGEREDELLQRLSALSPVEGRFDTVRSADGIMGIVDYAHTPDALKNVLSTIGEIRTRNEKLITVVGCRAFRQISGEK